MEKIIKLDEECEKDMITGLKTVLNILSKTLGPKGRNVLYDSFDMVNIVDDGTTIADQIELNDKMQNAVAKIVAKTSREANSSAGDGSTTTAVLTCALAISGLKYRSLGYNAAFIKRGMDKVCEYLLKNLATMSKPLSGKVDVKSIATISSGDQHIGDLISEAISQVSLKGIVTAQESNSFDTNIEISKGIEIEKGLFSPYLSNNQEKNEFFVTNCAIFITDHSINTSEQMYRILENFAQTQKAGLLIIAEDIKPEPLLLVIANKFKKGLNIAAIKAPSFGDNRRELLEDLSLMTGCEFFSKDRVTSFNNINIKHFGEASSVKSNNNKTTLVSSEKFQQQIQIREQQLQKQLEEIKSSFERNKLEERIAKLNSGVAVINVGAGTETEMKAKKLKIEDALNAVKAASEEGIVAGGGTTFLRLKENLRNNDIKFVGDELIAVDIFNEALVQPLYKVIENSGLNPEMVVSLIEKQEENYGFNVVTLEYCNMVENGIIDPAKVIRLALQSASSTAGLLILTDSAILDNKKQTDNMPGELPY